MDKPWKTGVTLALEGTDTFTTIATTQAASWALIEDWPLEDGPALDRALLICSAVMEGKKPAEEARAAFIAAAKEAGLVIKA
jgi:hypothetical protein